MPTPTQGDRPCATRPPQTFADAVCWLRDHTDELTPVPLRLHDAAIGDHDASGAPRYSAPFWAVLTGSPFATRDATEERSCPLPHPLDAVCERCDNRFTYTVPRTVYAHPLAAALERLRKAPATSHDWPTPHRLVLSLMHSGYDLDVAAGALDHPILGPDHRKTVEAAFLIAIRALFTRWSSGPIPNMTKSDSQQDAESAA